jgi:inner membrane protein
MPTTLAHAVAGYAASEAASTGTRTRNSWWSIALLAAVVANLPDLDFVPGLIVDNIPKYHRTMSHGLPAALLVATIGTAALQRWWKGAWGGLWLLIFVAYSSHLMMDVVIPDPTGGDGLRLFWPISTTWVAHPLPFLQPLDGLRMLDHGPTNETFWSTLFSGRGAAVFLIDALIMLPLIAVGKVIGGLSQRLYGRRTITASSSI